jgi:hypothetical protein
MAALALVLLAAGIVRLRPAWAGVARVTGVGPTPWPGKWLGGLAAAIVVPVVVYVAINLAKFGTPLSVPYDAQLQNLLDPHRRKVLAANDGSLFTLAAVPTQVLQLVRPDALRLDTTFPFVGAATFRPRVVGSLLFDQRDYTASLTAAMPGLVLLAVAGAVRVCRAGAAALRLPVIGAAVVLPVSWSFLYVAQRYASDCFPLLLLLAAAGLAAGLNRLERWSSSRRRTAVVAFAVVAAFGTWTGFAIALEYQRNLAPLVADDLRREYVSWQWDVADVLGVGHPGVQLVDALGDAGARDSLAVLGRCDAVYVSDGSEWRAAERTAGGGRYRLAVRFASAPRGSLEPILAIGEGPERFLLAVRHGADDTAVLTIPGRSSQGTRFTIDPGHPTVLDVVVDPELGELRVTRGRRVLLGAGYSGPDGDAVVGRDPSDPSARFRGRIERLPLPPELCREVTGAR